MDSKKTAFLITDWIRKYAETTGFKLVVGVSGGIDSALVSTLCCMTGIETYVVTIPIHQKQNQIDRANNHVTWLKKNFKNVRHHNVELSKVFDEFVKSFNEDMLSELGLANSKSRLRMVSLYQIASNVRGIVVGTGNKIEDFGVGFFTKYGDGGVDISPIADLTKTQVREIAKSLDIISEIIEAKPTDGLWEDDRTDEDQIGATYEELEWAMDYVDNKRTNDLNDRQREVIRIFQTYRSANHHKMSPIPIFLLEKNK